MADALPDGWIVPENRALARRPQILGLPNVKTTVLTFYRVHKPYARFRLRQKQQGIISFSFCRHLCPHRQEIHEPGLEDGAGCGLQRLIHPAVQFNLVVQRSEDMGNGALFREWWKWKS